MPKNTFHKVKPQKMFGDMPSPNKKNLPTIMLDFSTLPDGKQWEVGRTYEIVLRVKQIGKREGKERGHAEFEIMKTKGRAVNEKVRRYT